MSLLGIDIGTTRCKSVVFTLQGEQLAKSYRDYKIISKNIGQAELDSNEIWSKVKETIREVAIETRNNPIMALSVSSLGEAVVPVSKEGHILGNTILGPDERGNEFINQIEKNLGRNYIHKLTGNYPGTFYSLAKISWLKRNHPDLYSNTCYFLTWADFICYMLGGKAATNLSLACRTLLFDFNECVWSQEIMDSLELDMQKFAPPVKSGDILGYVRKDIAKELNLSDNTAIISGGHDQCCAALGSGIEAGSGSAMYGMGTYVCLVTIFNRLPPLESLYLNNMHIEHHVESGSFVSFIYNQSGGALIDWFLRTFFLYGYETPVNINSVYDDLFHEIPDSLNNIIVIPHFGATGPPDFANHCNGRIFGLSFDHKRGDILRAFLEGISFYIRNCIEKLPFAFGDIDTLVVTGGGSVSEKWLQITADILNKTIIRNVETEASSLGAAILAGKGTGKFSSSKCAINAMVHEESRIIPDKTKRIFYNEKFIKYILLTK